MESPDVVTVEILLASTFWGGWRDWVSFGSVLVLVAPERR